MEGDARPESEDHRSTAEDAYRRVIASFSKGLLVQFNTDVRGMAGTPELRVESVADDGVLLTESPNQGVYDWEVNIDDGRLTLFRNADTEWPDHYDPVVTIEVVGYDG